VNQGKLLATEVPRSEVTRLLECDCLEETVQFVLPPSRLAFGDEHNWVNFGLSVIWDHCNTLRDREEDLRRCYLAGEIIEVVVFRCGQNRLLCPNRAQDNSVSSELDEWRVSSEERSLHVGAACEKLNDSSSTTGCDAEFGGSGQVRGDVKQIVVGTKFVRN